MKPWIRLGIPEKDGLQVVLNLRAAIAQEDFGNKNLVQDHIRISAIDYRTGLGVLGFLGFRTDSDDLHDWRELGRQACDIALEYFYGRWRDPYDRYIGEPPLTRAQCRQQLEWIDAYRHGIMWCLALDQEPQLQKLLKWADTDLPDDEGLEDRTPEDCQFYILLSKWLRGEPAKSLNPLREGVQSSVKRRPRLLLAAFDAIVAGDMAAASKAILDHLKHYRKVEFEANPVWNVVSIDGTTLWHVARRRGMVLNTLGDDWLDLIVRP